MEEIEYFIWLAGEGFGGFINGGKLFVFPSLLVLLCIAMAFDVGRKQLRPADFYICLMPLLATVAILVCGVVFRARPEYGFLPLSGLVLCLGLCTFSVIKLRRIFGTVFMVSALILWYTLWCGFIVGMSIADNWV